MRVLISLFGILLYSATTFSQIVDIPDPVFKAFLIDEGVDKNGDGKIQISEAEETLTMAIIGLEAINSIEGIKAFANLQSLSIDFAGINTIDISGMVNLTWLDISATEIESINAQNCTALKTVHLLDPELLGTVDFSGCISLEVVDGTICADIIKFNNCTSLKKLVLFSCSFMELELEGCTSLTYFEVFDVNPNFIFDFSELIALDTFILTGFSELDLEVIDVPNLSYLSVDEISSLYVRECPNLEEVNSIFMSQFIDLDDLPKLKQLTIEGPQLEMIKIENCPSLLALNFPFLDVNYLIVRNCVSITQIEVINGIMSEFCDFTGLLSLKHITLSSGPREIILDGCYSLESFNIPDHSAAEVYDFSDCINLDEVNLGSCNDLKTLLLQNGSNETVTLLNPFSLSNVCVDPEDFIQMQTYLATFENLNAEVTTSCQFANGGEPFSIIGTSYLDVNNDSCKTSTQTLPFSKYVINDDIIGDRYFYANEEGKYQYNVIEGQYSFGPELLFGDYIFSTFPETRTADFPTDGGSVNQDFCFISSPEEVDVIEVHLIPLEPARPGFNSRYLITYTNTGNVTRGGDIKLTFQDELMDFLISEPMESTLEEGFIYWSFEDLVPYETRSIEFSMNLNSPMDTPPLNGGDILNLLAEVGPLGNQTLNVYWSYLNQEIVNSFDPNDKTCLNGNAFDQELVGDYLKYMIRFENTGSAEAVNIVVTDTLDDTKFDVRTLQVINASHDVETELVDNVVKFIFKDIYLPFEDETNDGYVTFKIKTLPSLVLGDDVQNKAEIFFDFNFPIVTNTTSTVISDFTSVNNLEQNTFDLKISPNPASESILINSEAMMNRIELLDFSGRLLQSISFLANKSQHMHSINHILPGVYFIKAYSKNSISIEKIVIK